MSTSDAEANAQADETATAEPQSTPHPGATVEERLLTLQESNLALLEERRRALSDARYYKDELNNLRRETRRLLTELEKARTPPLIVGTVEDLLADERVVVKASTGPNFVVPVADQVSRKDLFVGSRVSLAQNNLTIVSVLPPSRDPEVAAAELIERPRLRYKDVGGLTPVIEAIREAVEYPLTDPERFARLGVDPPRGVLLVGGPGTGKTLLAKAVAGETNAAFIRVVGSELVQKFIGEGARRVHELFKMAREKSPSILFIDELDAIGARRIEDSTASNREVERTLMQLLAEMDGFDVRGEVRLMAATNRPDILDPALTRPGRFDRRIEIPLPDRAGLEEILKIHTEKLRLGRDVVLAELAGRLAGWTGADVRAIATEAGMAAVRRNARAVQLIDFDAAIVKHHSRTSASGGSVPAPIYA